MNTSYERRADRPDAQGRYTIRLVVTFDNQRLRLATKEKCRASEWNDKSGWFRKSFGDLDNATLRLQALRNRVETAYSQLRTKYGTVTAAQLKLALAVAAEAPTPKLTDLFGEYVVAMPGLGFAANTVRAYRSVHNTLTEWIGSREEALLLSDFDMTAYEELLGWLRSVRGLADNSVAGFVKRLKPFLLWARESRGLVLSLELSKLKVEWEQVEKVWLSVDELAAVAAAILPAGLTRVRDAFLFCCYTGLRYSDLHDLHLGNVHDWQGNKVLRLIQTKTRTGVSIYLTPPALALLAKYEGTRVRLLPVMTNQVMNRALKRICRLAGLSALVEVVETMGGRVLKRAVEKWELVTMHTARHTFATQSLMRGMPVEVLQKVLGHANIKTTLLYAKIIEDFQHQTMRRIWEGGNTQTDTTAGDAAPVCAVSLAS
ncbi:tyrosine-type recombinase/integrase [Hymenobacter lutimineralis]|uniref:Tyrosine-type recombinase/integrase n=1 Tax=Hymenobacter lutimineralis TaxID=2606448 RepID=A0A5D6VBD6_9BACT|nr:site-specific integrase [Hymenobacter lutimineralis]TYZ12617.1 tyrosine-type recombinase/integrase [Hymenobacter lutimineralis]